MANGPNPGPPAPLPLAPPEKFVGAKPAGQDGDFYVRPWLDSMETWFRAQPHLHQDTWLPTALSYMDHSSRTTWTSHLLPDLVEKHNTVHPDTAFNPTWADFKAAMIGRFGGQSAKLAAAKLKAHKCRYSSSMHEYSSRFRALVDKANEASETQPAITPREQASLFLAGLPRELQVFITGAAPAEGFATLADCETFCTLKQTQYNGLSFAANQDEAAKPSSSFRHRSKDRPHGSHKRSRSDSRPPKAGGSSSKPPRSSRSDRKDATDKSVKCAYCKRPGHHITECRTRQKKHASSPAQDATKSIPKSKDKKDF